MANELRRNSLLKESACFADHTSPASLWPEEQPDSQASSGSTCIKPGCQCPRPQSSSPPLLQNALSSPVSIIQMCLGKKTFKASPPAKWCGKSNGSKTLEREEMKEVKGQREGGGLPHQGGGLPHSAKATAWPWAERHWEPGRTSTQSLKWQDCSKKPPSLSYSGDSPCRVVKKASLGWQP